jgi:hypothetical protein
MQLKPNIKSSDRSWVWTVAAENTASTRTLAVRFPQPTGTTDALQFKTAIEAAQTQRWDGPAELTIWYAPSSTPPRDEEEEEEEDDEYGGETGSMAFAFSTIPFPITHNWR